MAQFEGIVRPVVFPNIRPTQARPLTPATSDQDAYVIRGSSGQTAELRLTTSGSFFAEAPTEIERTEDFVRVYQVQDNDEVNKENFVDLAVAKKISMVSSPVVTYRYRPVEETDNVEILSRDHVTYS
jgi:hypothetical protein